jgi:pilus assembly protein CpaB
MLARNTLLAIGIIALALGAIVAAVWLRETSGGPARPVAVLPVWILVAARELPAGTLLRMEDLTWHDVPPAAANAADYLRGSVTQADFAGAVTRVPLAEHQALTADDIVKPGDRGFLVATLAPGDRAVSIAVDAVQSDTGLVLPGDWVDVVLTQHFMTTGDPGHRSVGETVLHDLRIIAVDQALTSTPLAAEDKTLAAAEPKMPKTVTLEVTEPQAQMLLVAVQLGSLQLSLRGRQADGEQSAVGEHSLPTWASDVSPALEGEGTPAPANKHAPLAIEVIHGAKIEHRCFSDNGLVGC